MSQTERFVELSVGERTVYIKAQVADILIDIIMELQSADVKHVKDPMTNMRVGFKTLECEVKELEREVERSTYETPRLDLMRHEGVQCGAMAVKFLRDICDKPKLTATT